MKNKQKLLSLFLISSRPWFLLIGLISYVLGAGIVHYLGKSIDMASFILGQAWVTMVQLSFHLLKSFFDFQEEPIDTKQDDSEEKVPLTIPTVRRAFLQASITTLTITAVLTVLLFSKNVLGIAGIFFLALIFLVSFLYAVPPFRLVYRGYGELSESILLANFIPAYSYLAQTGELHSLLAKLTFPLTVLYLAAALALSMTHYANDIRLDRKTFLIRVGCERGMSIHNLLILLGFLLLVGGLVQGLPWSLTWPGLLTFPLGLYQIRQVMHISEGGKPRWKLLSFTALTLMLLTTYFLMFSLWIG